MTWTKLDPMDHPVRIIDRRQQEQDGPSPEDLASDERDRQAKREGIKRKIAEHTLELQKAAMLQDEVQRINREADTAADAHSAICQPPNKREDIRRAEIIRLIEEQNEILTEATEKAKRLRAPLEDRIQTLQIAAAPLQSLENQLANIGIGDPALIIALHVAQRRSEFAKARASAARKALGICQYNLTEITANRMSGGKKEMQFRVDRWQAEVQAADDEQRAALAECSEIHQAMIAE